MILIDKGIVQGSAKQAQPIIVDKDTVFIHENITPIEKEIEGSKKKYTIYEYHEYQANKDEYLANLYAEN